MPFVLQLIVAFFLLAGSFFALMGSIGLWRFNDFFMRLHGPAKATTLGVGSVLIASMLYFSFTTGSLRLHELLITLFLVISAPVSAYMLSIAAKKEASRERSARQ
ncbi:MAG: Na+/H+ antiporter subunit G [Thiopseudomonas sp.]|nr:Na+/H+ antiporter subunit G [Thiopseudomonas sp.]